MKEIKQKQRQERTKRGPQNYSETVKAKVICCVFKFGFFQSICKAFLIFMSNLELALSLILKERPLCESKDHMSECKCLET